MTEAELVELEATMEANKREILERLRRRQDEIG
jgi:hypothetical protein